MSGDRAADYYSIKVLFPSQIQHQCCLPGGNYLITGILDGGVAETKAREIVAD